MNIPKGAFPAEIQNSVRQKQYEDDKRLDYLLTLVEYLSAEHFFDSSDNHPEHIRFCLSCVKDWHKEVLDRIISFEEEL